MTEQKAISILYVEDDEGLIRLLQRRLQRQGYEIVAATSGENGIEMYDPMVYDVVLLDYNLPGMSGLDVLRILAERENDDLIPIIMLTGGGNEKLAVEALKLGAKDYIVKDVAAGYMELLPTIIERALATYKMELENHQAEIALRESERRYRDLVQNSMGLIFTHDEMGILQSVNPAMADIFGFQADGMIGMNLAHLISEPAEPFMQDYLKQCRDQDTSEGLMYIMTRNQNERVLMYRNSRHKDSDGRLYVLGHALDITERKRREEHLQMVFEHERKLNEFRSRLITTLSHEFRTPMTIISTLAEILKRFQDRLEPDKIQRHVETILKQIHTLDSILKDVLFMYETEAVGLRVQPRWIDLVTLCEAALEPLQLSTEGTHQLKLTVQGKVQQVYLDDRMLQRVINNLLSNAIKYSPNGGLVELQLEYGTDDVTISVRDEGIGIPEKDFQYIYDVFHRASNVGEINGTGIGLAIVKNTVDAHQGRIHIESELGNGTCVSIILSMIVPTPDE